MKTNPKVNKFLSALRKSLGLQGDNPNLLKSIEHPEVAAKRVAHDLGSSTQPLKIGFKPTTTS